MKTLLIASFFSFGIIPNVFAQGHGFPYGEIRLTDINMNLYPKDSSASAVVLREFGEAYVDLNELNKVIFDYHVVIKILKTEGLKQADYEIPLHQFEGKEEVLKSVRATVYNYENNNIVPTHLEQRNVFTDRIQKNRFVLKKFAVPNVKVGSVIEIEYSMESPWLFNFHTWTFQSDIPKIKSEYWATYPANYEYNITLRGFKNLDKTDSKVLRTCVGSNAGYGGTASADCSQHMFLMNDIPAFEEEEYMTAKQNFISAIYFELSVLRHFDGAVKKFTREWKDVDLELRRREDFGAQIRKARDVVQEDVMLATIGAKDPLEKAKKIYSLIQSKISWNEDFGFLTDAGVKKAYETKRGGIPEINLLLVGALQAAELDAEPVLLSTRAHGLPNDVHPVLSSFNYVIATLKIGEQNYLLDASDPMFVFGMLPERCVNGKGRVMPTKDSYWIDLKPTHKYKQTSVLNLKLEKDGTITGTFQNSYIGYAAAYMRKKILSKTNRDDYVNDLEKEIGSEVEVEDYEAKELLNLEAPLIETYKVKVKAFENTDQLPLLFNPFIVGKQESNPFKARERLYPVDFGVPQEETVILTLEYPETLKISELPAQVGLSLPNGGGRYLQNIQNNGKRLSMSSALTIAKTVYTSAEYHFLKELYTRMIAAQNVDLVFEKAQP
jgi:hypothetical protein